MTSTHAVRRDHRLLLNKVPLITIYFWIIKILCTTVGETAADFLNVNLGLGLGGTSAITGILLVVALALQLASNRYVPAAYWVCVTLVSVFGTLVTDTLSTTAGVALETSTVVFAAMLAVVFTAWYRSERTLSIHSIVTTRRESFYWLAILVTFALGTATGDLMAEVLGLGYLPTGVIVAVIIAVAAVGWRVGLNPVLAFWIIYILTRPLGASIGDYLSQPPSESGLGLGVTVTSLIFLIAILVIVTYLSISKADVIRGTAGERSEEVVPRGGLWQTVAVVTLVVVASGVGYSLRKTALQDDTTAAPAAGSVVAAAPGTASAAPAAPAPASPLGDLSAFRVITQDTLNLLRSGDQAGATSRVDDLERQWDKAQARLKPRSDTAWTKIDDKIDTVLRELRATNPDPAAETAALTALLGALG
jgi:uncharacterized membrane-anchored protein